jgi:hypothetical protein
MSNKLQIELPANFTNRHQHLVLKYLTQGRRALSPADWQHLLAGFDFLHQAQVMIEANTLTFRQVYAVHVEQRFADLYINELLQLQNVAQQHTPLRARIARLIVNRLKQANLRPTTVPASNLLLVYCLYFWESFSLGYAFEIEVYRDLTQSGITFQAHDIRERQGRMSDYDLQILNQYGDIKTSLYFIYARRSRDLRHDFYITRFYEGQRQRTLVVMLKPHAWEQINGDTIKANLEEASQHFPAPVMVQVADRPIVIIDYNIWKTRVLKQQQNE